MGEKILPDTSVIINGMLFNLLESEKFENVEILIPTIVVEELQSQASKGRESGFIGLKELKKLRELCEEKGFRVSFIGERPSLDDIRLAKSGRLDALIIDIAKKLGCTLYTSDYVQALTSEAYGVKVRYIVFEGKSRKLKFEEFFTPDTLSIHLKEGVPPLAKRGFPGNFKLVKIGSKVLTVKDVEEVISGIFEAMRSGEGFYEITRSGAM
ncbi:MAG: PIN domain-containing protein, partial [Candidatus Bathyarchaeota archaeon]|nr:PIN domain-containing protein [Candidatus Bathyarchaeota archaeon]